MTARVTIGIDPGLDGAVAVISGGAVQLCDTPTCKSKKREYMPDEMAAILAPYQGTDALAIIETVSGRPGEGAASARSIGLGFGLWLGILAALRISREPVTPATWKRGMGLLGADKNASRAKAQALFPAACGELQRVKDHGRAEALLLAHFGRIRMGGGD